VKHLGREQADTAVMVLGVVPEEDGLAKATGILDRAEAFRKPLPVRFGLD
jgi:hypothetical protein